MNRNFKHLRVQTKIEFDSIISQLDNGSPLTQIQIKKSGIRNLDLFETQDDKYETPKESSNSLMDEDMNKVQIEYFSISKRRIRKVDLTIIYVQQIYRKIKIPNLNSKIRIHLLNYQDQRYFQIINIFG